MGERAIRFSPERRRPSTSTSARSARRSRSSTAGSRRAAPTTPTIARAERRRRRPRVSPSSCGRSRSARRRRPRSVARADPAPALRAGGARCVEAADLFNASASTGARSAGSRRASARREASIVPLSGVDRRARGHGRMGDLLVPVPGQPESAQPVRLDERGHELAELDGGVQRLERARRGRRPRRPRHREVCIRTPCPTGDHERPPGRPYNLRR